MNTNINRVAVLGAGTTGAAIAAHCANAGLRVTLLDLSADVVRAGFERMVKARPPALFTPATASSIALGHPMGATGAKLTVQVLGELQRRGGRYGMVTMCVGGGQGAAGIVERLTY